MDIAFEHPWFVFAALLPAAAAVIAFARRRRASVLLYGAASTALLLAAARPYAEQPDAATTHAVVLDVSESMKSRDLKELLQRIRERAMPDNHSLEFLEVSDALREEGAVRGRTADFSRIGDCTVNGEVIFITDGRGDFDALYAAIAPSRLILLRPADPSQPDASVLAVDAPSQVPAGAGFIARASVRSDLDVSVPWQMLLDDQVIVEGTVSLVAGQTVELAHTIPLLDSGLHRLTVRLKPSRDREAANNKLTTRVFSAGSRVIRYCAPGDIPSGSDALWRILSADPGNRVERSNAIPVSTRELEGVSMVVINNLVRNVAVEELEPLATWVRSGGSLLMVGTGGAFGPGGYRNTPIEQVMPVRFRPDDAPPRRTLLLLDVSQSMQDMLPGGETKLQRLKAAANRFLDALPDSDSVSVTGFREGIVEAVRFEPPGSTRLRESVRDLAAAGSTHIRTSLAGALKAMPEDSRIVIITDGEELEAATPDQYQEIGARLVSGRVRLDIVLTGETGQEWVQHLVQAGGSTVAVFPVGDKGFDGLLETLDRAMAGADREWIISEPSDATGAAVPVPRLVRTSLRDSSVVNSLVRTEHYPVISTRRLLGRTVAVCTDSWGTEDTVKLWQDTGFRDRIIEALEFALEYAGPGRLALNDRDDELEIVWTSLDDSPQQDLETNAGTARLLGPGVWRVAHPGAGVDELLISLDGQLLQRLPVPARQDFELRLTGNDDAFFAQADSAGIRVLTSLDAWTPAASQSRDTKRSELIWLPTLLAMALLVAGFATRRK